MFKVNFIERDVMCLSKAQFSEFIAWYDEFFQTIHDRWWALTTDLNDLSHIVGTKLEMYDLLWQELATAPICIPRYPELLRSAFCEQANVERTQDMVRSLSLREHDEFLKWMCFNNRRRWTAFAQQDFSDGRLEQLYKEDDRIPLTMIDDLRKDNRPWYGSAQFCELLKSNSVKGAMAVAFSGDDPTRTACHRFGQFRLVGLFGGRRGLAYEDDEDAWIWLWAGTFPEYCQLSLSLGDGRSEPSSPMDTPGGARKVES